MAKKKKQSYWERRRQEDRINVKAIVWVGSIAAAIIIIMSILLIFDL